MGGGAGVGGLALVLVLVLALVLALELALELALVGACMRCSLRGWLVCAMVLSGGLRLVVVVCHARGVGDE